MDLVGHVLGRLRHAEAGRVELRCRRPRACRPPPMGTGVVGGAFATTIVTVDPGVAALAPAGLWLMTFPAGSCSTSGWSGLTLNPATVSSALARRLGLADDVRHLLGRLAGGDEQGHVGAAADRLAGPRIGPDRVAGVDQLRGLRLGVHGQMRLRQLLLRGRLAKSDDGRNRRVAEPLRDLERDGRSLVGLLPGRRILADNDIRPAWSW